MQGTIHRLIRGKGFGFIQTEERQYFFHHSEVRGLEFRQLSLGDIVEFQPVEEEPGKNPRAVEVSVLVKAVAPPPKPAEPQAEAAPAPRPERKPRAQNGRGHHGPRAAGQRRRAPGEDFGAGIFIPGGDGNRIDSSPAREDDEFSEDPIYGSEGGESDRDLYGPSDSSGEELQDSRAPYRGRNDVGGERSRRPSGGGGGLRTRRPQGTRGPGARGGIRSRGASRFPQGEDRPRRPKASGNLGDRGEGVVRSINVERGFGFIETATGDIFFHRSGVREGFESLGVGSRVAFVFGEGDRGSKAEDVAAV